MEITQPPSKFTSTQIVQGSNAPYYFDDDFSMKYGFPFMTLWGGSFNSQGFNWHAKSKTAVPAWMFTSDNATTVNQQMKFNWGTAVGSPSMNLFNAVPPSGTNLGGLTVGPNIMSLLAGSGLYFANPNPNMGVYMGSATYNNNWIWYGKCNNDATVTNHTWLTMTTATSNMALNTTCLATATNPASPGPIIQFGTYWWNTATGAQQGENWNQQLVMQGTAPFNTGTFPRSVLEFTRTNPVIQTSGFPMPAVRVPLIQTEVNCTGGVGTTGAPCTYASSGYVTVPANQTTGIVNTLAVSASSRIFLQADTSYTGCTVPAAGSAYISARVAGTSFTFTLPSSSGITCWNFWIVD
jgi:hypothetical protein